MDIATIQLETARVLRDQPDLRTIDKREDVLNLVRQRIGHAKYSTVERCIRKLQNQLGLYLPQKLDDRYIKEQEYREFFRK